MLLIARIRRSMRMRKDQLLGFSLKLDFGNNDTLKNATVNRASGWATAKTHPFSWGFEGLERERVVLLGFSQGACLGLEYAARHARRYGGLVGLSGGFGISDRLCQAPRSIL
jgi:pimeloyl-ACP methyl ester carboxylesterase